MTLTQPLFTILGADISGRGLILITGGLFLIAKSTHEIHAKVEGGEDDTTSTRVASSLGAVVAQIMVIDIVFLVLIGTNLVAEGFGYHIPKGYTYFAMAFSVLVELLNLRVRARAEKSGGAKAAQRRPSPS